MALFLLVRQTSRMSTPRRVTLRDVRDSDLPTFFAYQSDPEANRMAAFPARDREAFTAHWAKIRRDPGNILKTILFEGEVAGNIGSWAAGDRRFVGYWVGREAWGKGIATAALEAFVAEVKERPLHAFVAKHNLGSIRVLEKCGFIPSREDDVHGPPLHAGEGEDEIHEVLYVLSRAVT